MLTLAQLGALSSANVPPLPGERAGLFERLVLTDPLPTAVVLLIAGAAAFVLLRRLGQGRIGLAGLAAGVVLAAAVTLTGWLVETPRERLIALTDRLVASAVTPDVPAVESMLAPDCTLSLGSGPILTRDHILSRLRALGPGTITRHRTGNHQAVLDTPASGAINGIAAGRTQVRVWVGSSQSLYDADSGSTWRLYWQRERDGPWLVVGIECLQIDGLRPEMLR